MKITEFIQKLPKVEIHIHLEGATQPETVLELARRHNMLDRLPSDQLEDIKQWFVFHDFPHFLEIYFTIQDLMRTPEDFALLVYQCGADMAAQNIRYRELTFTPYTHTDHLDKGLAFDDILAGLEQGRQKAQQEFGVEMRWVFDISRNQSFDEQGKYDPAPAERALEFSIQGMQHGVIGFGLGGFEPGGAARAFCACFQRCQSRGLVKRAACWRDRRPRKRTRRN